MPAAAPALRFDEPATAPGPGAPLVILTHGAGGSMDEPVLETVARGLVTAGLRVARFEFPYMAARRADGKRRPPDRQPVLLDTWRAAVAAAGDARAGPLDPAAGLVIGGKSMGGR